jgi:hypothetical protein
MDTHQKRLKPAGVTITVHAALLFDALGEWLG